MSYRTKVAMIAFLGVFAGMALADTYDEKLEFVETTGSQWIDTGLRLNFKRARVRGRFRLLENPSGLVGIAGVTDRKDNFTGRDYDRGGCLYSFALRVGMNGANPRFYADWTGGHEDDLYSRAITLDWGYEFDGKCAYVKLNGGATTLGYSGYQADRRDELIAEGCTFFIGNVNNGGEGLATAEGSMPKVQWYGVTFWDYNKETGKDELIGDFIPARKNGVAGFFDTVTETFFASQGIDAFVAPNRIAWTGNGAAGDFLDKDNWNGVAAPSAKTDVAVIPDKMTVSGTYANLKSIQKIGGISLAGADSLLQFSTATEGIRVYVPLFGTGTFRLANTGSTAYFCSESSAFEGLTDFYNANVRLDTFHGFGGEKTKVRYEATSTSYYMTFNVYYNSAVPFAMHMVRDGQYIYADAGVAFDGPFVCEGDSGEEIKFQGTGGSCNVIFNNEVTNASSVIRRIACSAAKLTLQGTPKHPGQLTLMNKTINVLTPVDCVPLAKHENAKVQTHLAIYPEETGLNFSVDNALGEYSCVLLNWEWDLYDRRSRWIDLNGHDQTIGTLALNSDSWFWWNDPSQNHYATNTIIKSATPATLTLTGYCRNRMLYPENNYVYPGQLNGAVSFLLDSRTNVMATAYDTLADNCGVIRFSGALSTTTGKVAVVRGLVDITARAAFSNLTELAVYGEGQMRVRTSAIGVANECFHVSVTNVTTGKLTIDTGVVLEANTAVMGDGKWLSPGDYSSTASVGVRACPQLAGDGVLRVRTYGGPLGFMILIR